MKRQEKFTAEAVRHGEESIVIVIPAKAGIHRWIPAFAGMTYIF